MVSFFHYSANITISSCCQTNYCNVVSNNKVGREKMSQRSIINSESRISTVSRSATQICNSLFGNYNGQEGSASALDLCTRIFRANVRK